MPAPVNPTLLDLPFEIYTEIFKHCLPDTYSVCNANERHVFTHEVQPNGDHAFIIDCCFPILTCPEGRLRMLCLRNPTLDPLLINKQLYNTVRNIDLPTPTINFCSHACARRFHRMYPACPYLQPGMPVRVVVHVQLEADHYMDTAAITSEICLRGKIGQAEATMHGVRKVGSPVRETISPYLYNFIQTYEFVALEDGEDE